ncbi:MAG: peptidoglycan DD-metalloendopeptidase family protein [Candidatus Marinimicrobia bacterium]|jgi:septal ring factor EnvC (AmiA/AmiB activator)|nr:peptidoglycan DD-metalloendopeptidase family protein [Candidatus Neomarinimicrobiota bacterium]MDP7121280.1 peptidoglycan DD-metalloendopeptidase family protein [Candidatus Neomarinimicrobiota bacterium]MDP7528199.1 peptidoglycan DD-metalloendopeptidase family protein [Candidatus Neomarinimicrobiota bacterium]MDP7715113.1 peptidoglycan DD-metalloendopeptidase family protein [Candidatus Neomarinimicrobiota bacterium]HJM85750.1 peptidoglycan DD-metalloendopeptidase family protein [Candidatus N|tara:strand:+ start:3346 stop:4536 length:1191 start_codon:yes stop_codon:yes gene_type:complete
MKFPLTFSLFILLSVISGQTEKIEKDIQFHNSELDLLRKEIADYERKIKNTSDREKSEIERLNEIDEEISLVRNLIYRLRREEKIKEKSITQAEVTIEKKESEHTSLINRYAKRVTHTYKKGRLSDLEKLLDAKSWRQAVYRAKYIKIISEHDRSLADDIRRNLVEIDAKRTVLERELTDIRKIDKEKLSRKKWLEQRRRVRNKELGNLKRDRQKMSVALNQRKKAAQQMESIISRLERERVARIAELERKRKEMELLGSVPFKELKGKLPWPIEGKVISRFGTYQNPNLKTVTENTGIDIHGSEGTAVKSIYDGIVTTVTYIRGYGNTVILDHGDGFYSVYTHVTDVEVEENSYVNARDIIAHVGDSGSLEGTKLHFEIWGNKDKLNPELWLQKR